MDAKKLFADAYTFNKGEVVAVNGRLARGFATIIDVSYDSDSPLAAVGVSPAGETNGRPMPPHVRVKMIGSRTIGPKTGKSTGTFLFHAEDIAADKLAKLSEIDFV